MPKYKIAVLPGDGVGKDVIEAAMIVLDKLSAGRGICLRDIGWEFWCKEGNPLPDRTDQAAQRDRRLPLRRHHLEAQGGGRCELDPGAQGQRGLSYFSPIVRLRQEFDLYTNRRPCKAYPGNPLNYQDGIDLVIFRENTEGMYAGVEFHPLPEVVRDALLDTIPKMKSLQGDAPRRDRHVHPDHDHRAAPGSSGRPSNLPAVQAPLGHPRREAQRPPRDGRADSGHRPRSGQGVSGDPFKEANVDAMCMWLVKNPHRLRRPGVPRTSSATSSPTSAPSSSAVWGSPQPGTSATSTPSSSRPTDRPPSTRGCTRSIPSPLLLAAKMMLDWLGETDKGGGSKRPSPRSSRRERCAPTTWAGARLPSMLPAPWQQSVGERCQWARRSLKKLSRPTRPMRSRPGKIVWLDLDVRSARDFGGPNVVKNFEPGIRGDAPQ